MAQRRLQIVTQRLVIEDQTVGVLDAAIVGAHGTGQADTDGKRRRRLLTKADNEVQQRVQELRIALCRSGDAASAQDSALLIQQQAFNLGAANVQSQS